MEIAKAVSDLAFVLVAIATAVCPRAIEAYFASRQRKQEADEQHLTGNSDNPARCRPLPQRTKHHKTKGTRIWT
jgi:hypothetical protein